jgi:hypothetical protein
MSKWLCETAGCGYDNLAWRKACLKCLATAPTLANGNPRGRSSSRRRQNKNANRSIEQAVEAGLNKLVPSLAPPTQDASASGGQTGYVLFNLEGAAALQDTQIAKILKSKEAATAYWYWRGGSPRSGALTFRGPVTSEAERSIASPTVRIAALRSRMTKSSQFRIENEQKIAALKLKRRELAEQLELDRQELSLLEQQHVTANAPPGAVVLTPQTTAAHVQLHQALQGLASNGHPEVQGLMAGFQAYSYVIFFFTCWCLWASDNRGIAKRATDS